MSLAFGGCWFWQFGITQCSRPGNKKKDKRHFFICSLSLLKSLIFCGKRYFLKQRQLPVPSYPPHGKSHDIIFARSSSQGACDDFGARILFRKFVPPPFAPGSFKTTLLLLLLASSRLWSSRDGSWLSIPRRSSISHRCACTRRYRYFFHRLERLYILICSSVSWNGGIHLPPQGESGNTRRALAKNLCDRRDHPVASFACHGSIGTWIR